VVCDGVSSSQSPAAAARAGSAAARDALLAALREGIADDVAAAVAALSAAHDAVADLPFDPAADLDPPEATIVAAVRRGRRVAVAWLGDSRAYYVSPEVARQLTADHSWLREEVEAGAVTLEEGLRSPLAHAVTRTLGGPEGRDEPEARAFDLPPGPGLLLLCTDGLWAAFPDPAELAREAWRLAAGGDAGAVARGLVGAAGERYGRDNATATVLLL
jgi:serine/threonine protein phosphatase PrpC